MRKWLRPDWRARLLDLFACFLIPLYTLLFTHDTRWFTTNFSVIAAARDQRHGFFLWGMLVGVYLLCVLLPVMAALPRPLWPRLCLLGGFLLLLSAVVLPYTPDELPKIADLHVIWPLRPAACWCCPCFCSCSRKRGRTGSAIGTV